ncbi:hypothetical protein [Enterocloster clostridioformis]|nr:hypothetical protein [Enterocloster clostridioformis]
MKIRKRVRQLCMFVLLLSLFLFQSIPAYAVGDGNLDGGAASVSA